MNGAHARDYARDYACDQPMHVDVNLDTGEAYEAYGDRDLLGQLGLSSNVVGGSLGGLGGGLGGGGCTSMPVKAAIRWVRCAFVAALLLLVVAKSMLGDRTTAAATTVVDVTTFGRTMGERGGRHGRAGAADEDVYFLVRIPKTGSTTFAEV